jgi:hypothetical protein
MDRPKEITNIIELLDVFETHLDVKLESLTAWLENGNHRKYQIRVSGEMHSRNGVNLKLPTRVIVDAYDSAGRILGTNNDTADFLESIDPGKFYGFHTFSVIAEIPITSVSKIRVYPKRCQQ